MKPPQLNDLLFFAIGLFLALLEQPLILLTCRNDVRVIRLGARNGLHLSLRRNTFLS